MFFKMSSRPNPTTGEPDVYYRLVESYRNADDRVCHHTLLNIGFINNYSPEQLNIVRRILAGRVERQGNRNLFGDDSTDDSLVNRLVEDLWNRLVSEKRIDIGSVKAVSHSHHKKLGDNWQTLDLDSLHHKDIRSIGGEWLCYQAIEELGLPSFFKSLNWSDLDIRLAQTAIISRIVYPCSELCMSRWITENSAVCELTGFPVSKINKDRLYRMSNRLHSIKDTTEDFLSHKTNELFDLDDAIILYDLSNTYYEGKMLNSKIAKHGRSKEKRSDAKLLVLGVVINVQGFIKRSHLLRGNISDAVTLTEMVTDLRQKTSQGEKHSIVVMDAGIATDENLSMLRDKGFDYICVRRGTLKDYHSQRDNHVVEVEDNKHQKIRLEKVVCENEQEYYLKIDSEAKRLKECSMNARFQKGFEDGLTKIAVSLTKKSGIKKSDKVNERIGRLKGKYPSIHRNYDITVESQPVPEVAPKKGKKSDPSKDQSQDVVTSLTWKLKENVDVNARSGVYFLRTSLQDTEQILWNSYNTIRNVESTFRCLKSDLDLRPIYHKKDDTSLAHLNLGVLAYQIVNTILYKLRNPYKQNDKASDGTIHWQWKEVIRVMETQHAITTLAQNKTGEVIVLRQCSIPNEKVQRVYDKVGYKENPFKKKKFVVHKQDFKNMTEADIGALYNS